MWMLIFVYPRYRGKYWKSRKNRFGGVPVEIQSCPNFSDTMLIIFDGVARAIRCCVAFVKQ